ncbi:MAG: hypothetical protein KC800_25535 [Candidatus Eremiobacteraeota bacterium]|nr:hypothetical protein [Candidatus Eremiobacteraeota bacterium]
MISNQPPQPQRPGGPGGPQGAGQGGQGQGQAAAALTQGIGQVLQAQSGGDQQAGQQALQQLGQTYQQVQQSGQLEQVPGMIRQTAESMLGINQGQEGGGGGGEAGGAGGAGGGGEAGGAGDAGGAQQAGGPQQANQTEQAQGPSESKPCNKTEKDDVNIGATGCKLAKQLGVEGAASKEKPIEKVAEVVAADTAGTKKEDGPTT